MFKFFYYKNNEINKIIMKDDLEFNPNLLENDDFSDIKPIKPLSFQFKIVIIISISLLLISIITVVILILIKNNDSKQESSIDIIPPYIIEPTSDYTHCIIWLHGLGSVPEKFLNLFNNELHFIKKENTKIILMRAPYQIMTFSKENKTSWFDILSFPINSYDSYNFTDAIKSRKMVEKIINEEAQKLNGKYQNIFLGGHSQGACITLYTAYNFKELLGGVLFCNGILFKEVEIIGDKNKLKVFLAHGEEDNDIPVAFQRETVKRIENFEGVKKYYYEGQAHNINQFEKIDMGGFLNETMI